MSPKDINELAHDLIANQLQAGEIVEMRWAVQELINSQGDISGDGVEFYALCAREHIYRVVKRAVDKYENSNSKDHDQLTLEGYECLQKAYTVERDNERKLVPVHLISDEELLARAAEFRRQVDGLKKHAEEIEKYIARRASKIILQ